MRFYIIENIIFNELKIRGYRVDVWVVEIVETYAFVRVFNFDWNRYDFLLVV